MIPDRVGARIAGCIAILGVASFVVVVVGLHVAQPHYDAINQLMSELALGPSGEWMTIAFVGFALAMAAIASALSSLRFGRVLGFLLSVGVACLLGAGVYRLGESDLIHISLVGVAFVSIVLGMFEFAHTGRAPRPLSIASVSLGIVVAASIALGHSAIPIGVAQRVGASAVLLWTLTIAIWLVKGARGER